MTRRFAAQLLFHEVANRFILWELNESYKTIIEVKTIIVIVIADWIDVDDIEYENQKKHKLW